MLFAPTLADRAILPTAWRGRYFFNRIGQKWSSHLQENRGDSIPFKLLVLCVTSELISREKEA
ncbi:hypothetical protein IPC1343_32790 [Pseudomonas aeruginosa]|nr:hypothetical protein IPC1343_32790 [Pseudomonas aeruginosa]